MKKLWIILPIFLFLFSGCGEEQPYETIGNVFAEKKSPEPMQIVLQMPDEAAAVTGQSNPQDMLYECDGYSLRVRTCQSGDLDRTLKSVTGFEKDALKMVATEQGALKRYICAWSCAGEKELQVGRTCVMDDGQFHYVVSTMAPESRSGQLQDTWKDLFSSFRIVDASVDLSTGS